MMRIDCKLKPKKPKYFKKKHKYLRSLGILFGFSFKFPAPKDPKNLNFFATCQEILID
jgi:hypothetical protein